MNVVSFKQPSQEELDHNFLWRVARQLPERGRIGIFNRSHYEEVLVVRVHPELMERQKGEKYFIGQPRDIVTGECKDTFAQVLNSGFPGGLLTVDQTVQMMNKACYKG